MTLRLRLESVWVKCIFLTKFDHRDKTNFITLEDLVCKLQVLEVEVNLKNISYPHDALWDTKKNSEVFISAVFFLKAKSM